MTAYSIHTEDECFEEIKKYSSAAKKCVEEGLETPSSFEVRLSSAWEEYYLVCAVRAIALLANTEFLGECVCKGAWGVRQKGLPAGFWPRNEWSAWDKT